jgi:hypothetical protein
LADHVGIDAGGWAGWSLAGNYGVMTARDVLLRRRFGTALTNRRDCQAESFWSGIVIHMLRGHGVAHVFNNWTRMPSIAEQLAISNAADAKG